MRIMVGIATNISIERSLQGLLPLSSFKIFLKGTLCNSQKKFQRINGYQIPDCLDDSRCNIFCVYITPDYAKMYMVEPQGISSFLKFGQCNTNYRITLRRLYCNPMLKCPLTKNMPSLYNCCI